MEVADERESFLGPIRALSLACDMQYPLHFRACEHPLALHLGPPPCLKHRPRDWMSLVQSGKRQFREAYILLS